MLRIKLVQSLAGNNKRNRTIVAALGLHKVHHTVDHRDTPQIRGMVHRVKHMLEVSEISESEAKPRTTGKPRKARTTAPVPGQAKRVRGRRVRPMPPRKMKRAKAPRSVEPKATGSVERKASSVKPETAKPKAKAAAPKAAKAKAEGAAEKKTRAKKVEK